MSYQQLTQGQRYQISMGLKMGMKKSWIARAIGVHRSTLTRELRRNASTRGGYRGYNSCQAVAMARDRHRKKRKYCIAKETWARVESLLRRQWSPEQISNRLLIEGFHTVSHETIYSYIYRNRLRGGDLYKHLRRRRGYRKFNNKYFNRKALDSRRFIGERPYVVDTRSRFGDWEVDTIIGQEKKGGIISMVERLSRYCLLKKVSTKASQTVADAICSVLLPIKENVLTITSDNGTEFMSHKSIASSLDADFFFADPYSSWQRGTNENTNGLVRQYFPKKSSFSAVSDSDIHFVEDRLNHRPRKVLGFRTPHEVFFNHFVALVT